MKLERISFVVLKWVQEYFMFSSVSGRGNVVHACENKSDGVWEFGLGVDGGRLLSGLGPCARRARGVV